MFLQVFTFTFIHCHHCTENHIFFFQTSWKDRLLKKYLWNIIFLVLSGKLIFIFPELWSYTLGGKWKMIFLKKIHGNMTFSSSFLKRWSFEKEPREDMIFLVLSGKIIFFSPKTWYFFLGLKLRNNLPQEIHGNKIFSVYTYGCYKRGATSLCQRNQRRSYPAKIHLKVIDVLDWQKAPAILCTFMEAFTGVFMYRSPAKKNRKLNT